MERWAGPAWKNGEISACRNPGHIFCSTFGAFVHLFGKRQNCYTCSISRKRTIKFTTVMKSAKSAKIKVHSARKSLVYKMVLLTPKKLRPFCAPLAKHYRILTLVENGLSGGGVILYRFATTRVFSFSRVVSRVVSCRFTGFFRCLTQTLMMK